MGRLEHLREAGEGLHDLVQQCKGRRRRRLERLRHARVRWVEQHAAAWLVEHVHSAVRTRVHAVHAVAVPGVPAEIPHAAAQRGSVGGEGGCAGEAVV